MTDIIGDLALLVRQKVPAAVAGILSGSSLDRPYELVDDRDVIVICADGTGQKVVAGHHQNCVVECTSYDILFPRMLELNESLRFPLTREVRKIVAGKVLFGHSIINSWRLIFADWHIPAACLLTLLARRPPPFSGSNRREDFDALLAHFETLVFVSFYLYGSQGPIKPKWYLVQIERFYPNHMLNTLEAMRDAIRSVTSITAATNHLLALSSSPLTEIEACMRRDALKLFHCAYSDAGLLLFLVLLSRLWKQPCTIPDPSTALSSNNIATEHFRAVLLASFAQGRFDRYLACARTSAFQLTSVVFSGSSISIASPAPLPK